MCSSDLSGTLPIEAALMARNIPPGKFRKSFSFMNWKDYEPELFEKIKEETTPAEFPHRIYAGDLLPRNILSAQTNARNARVFNMISFRNEDFGKSDLVLENGLILINPPYGERMKREDLSLLYGMIGERLKHRLPGNVAWILTSSQEMMQKIGLKPAARIRLYNGALECSFQKFELFEGKRKTLIINTQNKK